jgi:hypothetical protein
MSAIVKGSGVVVTGPLFPTGLGVNTGCRGRGLLGMFLMIQLIVRQFGSGGSHCWRRSGS